MARIVFSKSISRAHITYEDVRYSVKDVLRATLRKALVKTSYELTYLQQNTNSVAIYGREYYGDTNRYANTGYQAFGKFMNINAWNEGYSGTITGLKYNVDSTEEAGPPRGAKALSTLFTVTGLKISAKELLEHHFTTGDVKEETLDKIFGGNDIVIGSKEDDELYGYGGNDSITGGLGDDQLDGGQGNDRLFGGIGDDILTGGYGNDIFKLDRDGSYDIITDFIEGEDKIAISRRALRSGIFSFSSGATDEFISSNSNLHYNTETGDLFVRGQETPIGNLTNLPVLSGADFTIATW